MTLMQRAKSILVSTCMLGSNILKFFRPVLEDKLEKFRWKLLVCIVKYQIWL